MRITKDLRLYKEGYKKEDIILYLMGGTLYTEEMIENIKIQKLLEEIYWIQKALAFLLELFIKMNCLTKFNTLLFIH